MRRGKIVREFPAPLGLRLELTGDASDVVLLGTSEPKVQVVIHYRIPAWGTLAEEWEKALSRRPPLEFKDNVLRIGPEPEGIELDYEIILPNESAVEIRLGSGDISVQNFSGKLSVTTGSGDFWAQKLSGEFRLQTGSGDINLSQAFGAFTLRTGSGDVDGEEVKGSMDLETGSGDIELADFLGDLRLRTGSGDVEVKGEILEETWEIRTGSGDVFLALPKDSEMEVVLRSEFGDIACDFPLQAQGFCEGLVQGRVGASPKAKIHVVAEAGDIVLRSR
ncbi:MAG: DUF4097 family beta strand repeat-containing protein [Candidatus Bipolaricaulaceae bacterium]